MKAGTAFDRDALYEEVWRTPMATLAKQYGLSDQGLRKICVKLQIPLPIRGHWAKVAAGKAPTRPALEAMRDIKTSPRKQKPLPEATVPSNIDERLAPICWPKDLHPCLKPLRDILDGALATARRAKKKHDHPPVKRSGLQLDLDTSWGNIVRDGYLIKITHNEFVARISVFQYERALVVLSLIIRRLELAGFKPRMKGSCERIVFECTGQSVEMRVSEKFEIRDDEGKTWDGRPLKRHVPTGRLRVHIGLWSCDSIISDVESEPLEQRTDLVLAAVMRKHKEAMAWAVQREEERKAQEESNRAHAEWQAKVDEERRKAEKDKARKDVLINEAHDWQRAESIRQYVEHLDKKIASEGKEPHQTYLEWREWALIAASNIDKSDMRTRPPEPVDQSIEASISRLAAVGIFVNKSKHNL